MFRALAVAALAASLAPSFTAAQCSDSDKTALIALDKAWSEATSRGDAAYLGKVLSDGYSAINIRTSVDKATTIANVVQNAENSKANPNPNASVNTSDRYVVSCAPGSATITHRTVSTPAGGASGQPTYGRAFHFLEKTGKDWKVVSSSNSPVNEFQELVYLEMDWNDAAKNRDGDWFARYYDASATDVNSLTGAMENRAQSIESAKNDKRVFDSIELTAINTRIEGNAAVVTGINHLKGKDAAGKPFDRRVRFTDTWIKRDGQWKVWATQGTDIK